MPLVVKPYGTWPSPVSARTVAEHGLRLGGVLLDGHDVYWLEGRPSEGGRQVLVRCGADGRVVDVVPPDFNARTRVQEYGGGAVAIGRGEIYASNLRNQRLYRLSRTASGAGDLPTATPMTPEGAWRYADASLDARRGRLIAVREDHTAAGREAETTIVSIPTGGGLHAGEVLLSGHDFYATPRLSPDGRALCWLAWRHPRMPWEASEVWVADLDEAGRPGVPRRIAGGPGESIYQPGWTLDGDLLFASDRDGWWRLYRADRDDGTVRPVVTTPPDRAEFGRPLWTFGSATWTCAGRSRLVTSYTVDGRWHLGVIDLEAGTLCAVPTTLEPADWLAATSDAAVLVAGSPSMAASVVRIDLATGKHEVLRSSSHVSLTSTDVSIAESIWFPSTDGRRTHAFYYPPVNARVQGPADERPPVVVIGHGGPTGATSATFDVRVQFWTTRGFAVLDVNYGGSSGFGRAYRERLTGTWGLVDVADIVAATEAIVASGKGDAGRLLIRGGSAGGFTVLAALTTRPGVFAAGASYYGVSDLEALLADTHKFESRYLDGLIGPYPEARDVYRARSPSHHLDRLSCPLILLQGLDDKVVPPNQSEAVVEALRAKGVPVVYLAFEGEQHGFRKAETIVTSLEAELAFYGSVLGFAPADALPPAE